MQLTSRQFSELRDKIQAAAMAIVGKRYRKQGRGPHAFDCAGAVGYAVCEAGIPVEIPHDYAESARDETLLRTLGKQSKRQMQWSDGRPGDVVLFRIAPRLGYQPGVGALAFSHHCGILVDKGGELHVVHAHLPNRVVRCERLQDMQELPTTCFSVTD